MPSNVLVVDDEPRNRTLLREILKATEAVEVIEAENAEVALRILDERPIDLVLLDVMMPGMSGFDACREIKRRFTSPILPVLLLTALSDQQSRNQGYEAGADDFLSKPFDRRELLLRTRAFLRLRHHDEHMLHQIDELRRLDRLKDELTALIVHDLRNPLSGLSGLLWVLQREAGEGEHKEMIDDALTASRHMREAVEDMLKIRMFEEHQLALHKTPVSLRAIALEAVASVEGDARARGLGIEIVCDDEHMTADGPLLRRAIENLLANALRYTRPRTSVTLSVGGAPDQVDIVVADRGPGIPDELKRDVFEKYTSVEDRTGRPRRGHGLGLYLVKLCTEAHGGRVSVEDRPDGGSAFHLRIPRAA